MNRLTALPEMIRYLCKTSDDKSGKCKLFWMSELDLKWLSCSCPWMCDKAHYPAETSSSDHEQNHSYQTTGRGGGRGVQNTPPPLLHCIFLFSSSKAEKQRSQFFPLLRFYYFPSVLRFCIELQLFLLFCSTFSVSLLASCLHHSDVSTLGYQSS